MRGWGEKDGCRGPKGSNCQLQNKQVTNAMYSMVKIVNNTVPHI